MKKIFNLKTFVNKKTHQVSIVLPRKKCSIFKNKNPKGVTIEIKEIKW